MNLAQASTERPEAANAEGEVRLLQVSKSYRTRQGRRPVLEGVQARFRRGEHWGILGRNGAGKSTLIRLISGVEHPTSGKIELGMSVSWPIAFMGGTQGGLTGYDNTRFVSRVYGADYAEVKAYVEDFTELGKSLDDPVKIYSSGMRARLAFALSMAIDFDCFLIDEVLAVGDRRFRDKCFEELLVKRSQRAMILVSHEPGLVHHFCSHAAVLHDRRLQVAESVAEACEIYKSL